LGLRKCPFNKLHLGIKLLILEDKHLIDFNLTPIFKDSIKSVKIGELKINPCVVKINFKDHLAYFSNVALTSSLEKFLTHMYVSLLSSKPSTIR